MGDKGARIAVLSGKGGAGKTLVSVNLAFLSGESVYIDCDVEDPNGHLFFKPDEVSKEAVTVKIPVVDESLCNGCRTCIDFCKFDALAFIKNKPYVFDNICHSCGGCALLCPEKAIWEKDKVIGEVQSGVSHDVIVSTGIMNIGETSSVPIVKHLLNKDVPKDLPVFIDCPPRSSCIVMESIRDVGFCILVAEPTIFGVHNLSMAYDLVRLFAKPHGVILNKCLFGKNPAEEFCIEKNIPILGRIPFDPELGTLNSDAKIAARESERFRELFGALLETVMKEVRHETTVDS